MRSERAAVCAVVALCLAACVVVCTEQSLNKSKCVDVVQSELSSVSFVTSVLSILLKLLVIAVQ